MDSFSANPVFQKLYVEKASIKSFQHWYYEFYEKKGKSLDGSLYLDLFLFDYQQKDSYRKLRELASDFFGKQNIDGYLIRTSLKLLLNNPDDYYIYVHDLFFYYTEGYHFLKAFEKWYAEEGIEYISILAQKELLNERELASFRKITAHLKPRIVEEAIRILELFESGEISFE